MTLPRPVGHLRTLLIGKAAPYSRPGTVSAIDKTAVSGSLMAGELGLAGDEQGDHRVHGGPDKAVHCYVWQHYPAWRSELPAGAQQPLLQQAGAFGENFSIEGCDEAGVCIADQWRIGTAVFEISQGRQPCWKLNDRFGVVDMASRVQDSLRAGWYLRVLVPGRVSAGDEIVLLARPHPDWSVQRLLRVIRDRVCDQDELRRILALPLPESWRKLFQSRLENGRAEAWDKRLQGSHAIIVSHSER
ncbi:MAG: MOSC domain-containing protein [Burkholderiales bacterium]|jgi:MOSC domain-containing protein YiiM|nr:MOSC domain-containing protein [Burkholderiales bacterium]